MKYREAILGPRRVVIGVLVLALAMVFAVSATSVNASAHVSSAKAAASTGTGVTKDTINLGIYYSSDIEAAASKVGGNTNLPVLRTGGNALVKYINDHGGIAGHQVNAVWGDYKVTGDAAQSDQTLCTTWTQDNKVFAAMPWQSHDVVLKCLKNAKTIVVQPTGGSTYWVDSKAQKQYPTYFEPNSINMNELETLLVTNGAKQGYFDKGAKVGLLYINNPDAIRAVKSSLMPALKAKGIKVVDEARITETTDATTAAQTQTESRAAVLKFHQEGIDHVIVAIDRGGWLTGSFSTYAETQGYRPRYLASSVDPQQGGPPWKASPQWVNSVFMFTYSGAYNPTAQAATPQSQKCADMERAEGVTPSAGYDAICDYLTWVKTVLEKTSDWSVKGFQTAAESLGLQKDLLVTTFGSNVTGARHSGAAYLRMLKYDEGCGCFKPSTGMLPTTSS